MDGFRPEPIGKIKLGTSGRDLPGISGEDFTWNQLGNLTQNQLEGFSMDSGGIFSGLYLASGLYYA